MVDRGESYGFQITSSSDDHNVCVRLHISSLSPGGAGSSHAGGAVPLKEVKMFGASDQDCAESGGAGS